jgi:hypothetical protein
LITSNIFLYGVAVNQKANYQIISSENFLKKKKRKREEGERERKKEGT